MSLTVDGYWRESTNRALQEVLGTYVDGIVSSQPIENKNILGSCVATGAWEFVSNPSGSSMIKALQERLGVEADGLFGHDSICALQSAMGTTVDGSLDEGSYCVMAMQKQLNSGTFLDALLRYYDPSPKYDGIWGPSVTSQLQTQLGTPVDGVVSSQYSKNKEFIPGAGDGWEWSSNPSGSTVIKNLQAGLGIGADGIFGKGTATALQKFLVDKKYDTQGIDGYFGANSVCAFQQALDDGVLAELKHQEQTVPEPTPAPKQDSKPSEEYDDSKFASPMVGIDVSSHDDFNGEIYKANTESCYVNSDFIIIKVSQGTGYLNPQCDGAYQRAKRDNILRGFYHYAGGGDPEAEAQYFYDHSRGYVKDGIPCLDWESYQNSSWGDTNWCRRFVNKFHELSGVWCMIYVQASATNQVANCANDCALWVAGYPDDHNSWDVPNFPYSRYLATWNNYTVWQYSSSNGATDRNVASITPTQWRAIARGE